MKGRGQSQYVLQSLEKRYVLERVERRAEHVDLSGEVRVCLQDIFPEEVLDSLVGCAVEMDIDLWLRAEVAVPDAFRGRCEKRRCVRPVLASLTNRPEDTVGDLIADIDNGRLDTLSLERVAHVERVLVYLSGETREVCGPTSWDLLLAWIGPGVTEMEVDVNVHARSLRPLGQSDVVVEVIIALGHPLRCNKPAR